jgi:hypothetical protein
MANNKSPKLKGDETHEMTPFARHELQNTSSNRDPCNGDHVHSVQGFETNV